MNMRQKCCALMALAMFVLSACTDRQDAALLDLVPLQSALVWETNRLDEEMEALKPYLQTMDASIRFEQEMQAWKALLCEEGKPVPVTVAQSVFACLDTAEGGASFVAWQLSKSISNKDLRHSIESKGMAFDYVRLGNAEYFRSDSAFFFAKAGRLVYSRSENALLQVCHQMDNPQKITDNNDFAQVQSTVGSAVSSHVFVNYSLLEEVLAMGGTDRRADGLTFFVPQLKGLAALDMLTKGECLVWNGYSKASDSLSCLKPLKYQRPVRNSIVNVVPFNTKLMLHYGMSDYVSFWEEFSDKQKVAGWNQRYGVDIEKQLLSCLTEVSYCSMGNAVPVMVARVNDPVAVIRFWNKVGTKAGVSEVSVVQGYTLNNVNVKGFVPDVFGSAFKEIQKCCYSIVDQYLVVANDFQALRNVVACYRSGRTLDLNESFKAFQNNMLESANLTLFVIGSGKTAPSKAFSVQLASAKDLVYTCACLKKWEVAEEEGNVAWKVNLDAPLGCSPQFMPSPVANARDVLVFDKDNAMYLIDCNGNLLWKKTFSEAPMGSVVSVDAFSNGQRQFLFNTANYLHLLDRDGNYLSGFPRKLEAEASNGLMATDYNGTSDCRILLCGTNRLVYNYNLKGEEVEGWNRHRADGMVTQPIQYLLADNKDFLVVTDERGAVSILDRQGRVRIPLSSGMNKSQNAGFSENRTNQKGVLLTADVDGKLLYVGMDGGLARTDFGDFSDKHFFLYEDFDANQDKDFIYLDGRSLQVFDRFKKVLYEHEFDAEISSKPFFFDCSRNKRLLCVVSEKARELYMIDKDGKLQASSGLVGDAPFAIGSLHDNNEINLVTGVGNALFNYVIR